MIKISDLTVGQVLHSVHRVITGDPASKLAMVYPIVVKEIDPQGRWVLATWNNCQPQKYSPRDVSTWELHDPRANEEVESVDIKLTSIPLKAKPVGRTLRLKPKPPSGPDPIAPEQYFGGWGTPYNRDGAHRIGYLCLPVLPDLWGRKLDEVVIAYVNTLRPSIVRITEEGIKLDSRLWRVTVWTEQRKRLRFVRRIEQEVEVLLPKGVAHGNALELALKYGTDSPQVKWHLDATGYTSASDALGGGFWKDTAKGCVKWNFKPLKRNPKIWWRE